MAYELHVQRDGVRPCSFCSIDAVTRTFERVEEAAGLPLWRSIRRSEECENCHRWRKLPVDRATRARHPRTPGLWRRIAISWAILVAIPAVLYLAFWGYREYQIAHSVRSPSVGDRWTVKTAELPAWNLGVGDHALVRVEAVQPDIAVAACTITGSTADVQRCTSFDDVVNHVDRAQVRAMFDAGTIVDIDRWYHRTLPLIGMIVWFVLTAGLLVVHARRTRRALAAR